MTPPIRVCAGRRGLRAVAVSACGVGVAMGALAADGFGGGVGVATAQTQRGVSLSSGKPALFGDLTFRWDGVWQASLGAARWGAVPGRASGEYTLALSRSWLLDGDWSVAAGVSHYGPLGGDPARRVDYDELSVSLSWQGCGQVLVAVSPNNTAAAGNGGFAKGRTATVELSWHERIAGRLAADAGLGHYDLSALGRSGYSYASAGFSYGSGPWLASLAYVTNRGVPLTLSPELRRSRWLLSVWWSY